MLIAYKSNKPAGICHYENWGYTVVMFVVPSVRDLVLPVHVEMSLFCLSVLQSCVHLSLKISRYDNREILRSMYRNLKQIGSKTIILTYCSHSSVLIINRGIKIVD